MLVVIVVGKTRLVKVGEHPKARRAQGNNYSVLAPLFGYLTISTNKRNRRISSCFSINVIIKSL